MLQPLLQIVDANLPVSGRHCPPLVVEVLDNQKLVWDGVGLVEIDFLVDLVPQESSLELLIVFGENVPRCLDGHSIGSHPVKGAWPCHHNVIFSLQEAFHRISPLDEPVELLVPQPLRQEEIRIEL